ncbi:hypothetical protein b3_0112 [Synechococcus phage B3]|nr:hypothetical protein b3_0112 [Synechococcus phage B3]QGT54726.1 hypothetical protein b23_0111 [Synechococcus phage B23]
MNSRIKEKWIAALRSGEYTQGKKQLHSKEGAFCCLGVLCDLYLKEKGLAWEDSGDEWYELVYDDRRYATVPPISVREWAGTNSADSNFYPRNGSINLIKHNDELGSDFNKIADVIEAYF